MQEEVVREKLRIEVVCTSCGTPSESETEWRCAKCGGPFTCEYAVYFRKDDIFVEDKSMWRYKSLLPVSSHVSLGEGGSPTIEIEDGLWGKLDYIMPTGSFKDRGSATMISWVKSALEKVSAETIVEDSSGNAGASVAAYCARAGLRCEIFVPETIPEGKARQIRAFGAEMKKVKGSREDVARAAQEPSEGKLYASHAWNPFFSEGVKTISYEILEQLGWDPPDNVFTPASGGSLVKGIVKGFKDLLDSSVISKIPRVVACQPLAISTLYNRFSGKSYSPPEKIETVADALTIKKPARLEELVRLISMVKGECEVVDEDEIVGSLRELGRKGLFVEPSAAVSHAAWKKWRELGRLNKDETSVVILSGNGLKSQAVAF